MEEVDLDPRKEKEDPMSPRKELLWQTIYITLAQPEMQVTILRLNFLINYIEREHTDAGDTGHALRKGTEPDWPALRPTLEISKVDPTTGKDDAEKAKLQKELERDKEQLAKEWDTEHKTFSRRKDHYRQNQMRAAALLCDQCSQGMRTKLKSRSDWDDIERDPVKMLAAIKEHSMNYEASECTHKTVLDAWIRPGQSS